MDVKEIKEALSKVSQPVEDADVESVEVRVKYRNGAEERWDGFIGVLMREDEVMVMRAMPKYTRYAHVKESAELLSGLVKDLKSEIKEFEIKLRSKR